MKKISVFLSHNSDDKPSVEVIAKKLEKEKDIDPWLDKWNLIPGVPWQEALEEALRNSDVCVVFFGPSEIATWQNEEMRDAINQRVTAEKERYRVIPVILPGAKREERGRLPGFLTRTSWVEFKDSLDDDSALHCLLCGIRGIKPGYRDLGNVISKECPYRGLSFFDVDHAPHFFGREALTEWLIEEIKPVSSNRFLAIVGASGSGKSSLARAGLLYALKNGDIPESNNWPQVILFPGENPLENLAYELANKGILENNLNAIEDFIKNAASNERYLHMATKLYVTKNPEQNQIVILVDQFEEVFTSCKDEEERISFINNLVYASTISKGYVVLILTMRSDFYGKCAAFETLSALVSDHNLLVGPMNETEIRNVIERPITNTGVTFESGLVDTLVKDFSKLGALPLLQDTLHALWHIPNNNSLTYAAYREIGGLSGALNKRADLLYDQLGHEEKAICKQLFLRMTQHGEGVEDFRRRVKVRELLTSKKESEMITELISKLSDPGQRLVTTSGNIIDGDNEFIEVAHEALIKSWRKLQSWINEDREALRTHQRLREASEEWDKKGRDESYLFSGVRLAEMEARVKDSQLQMSFLEKNFINACINIRDRELNKKKERQRLELEKAKHEERNAKKRARVTLVVSSLVVVMSIIIGIYWWKYKEAQNENSDSLLAHAISAFKADDPRLAMRLGQQALRLNSNNRDADSLVSVQLKDYLAYTERNCEIENLNFTQNSKYLFFITKENIGRRVLNILNLETDSLKHLDSICDDKFIGRYLYKHSADSKYLSFIAEEYGERRVLNVLNLETDMLKTFDNVDSDSYWYSVDSKYLCFVAKANENMQMLKIYNLENDSIRPLCEIEGYIYEGKYSEDGKYVSFFTKEDWRGYVLKVLNLENDSLRSYKSISRFFLNIDRYSADSKYLFFITGDLVKVRELNVLNLKTDSLRSIDNVEDYMYRAGSKYMSFVTIENGGSRLLKVLNLKNDTLKIIDKIGGDISLCSANRKYVSFITEENGSRVLKVVNLENNSLKHRDDIDGFISGCAYSADSKYLIYFTDEKEGLGKLNVLNLENDSPQYFHNCYTYNCEYSDDSKYLSFFILGKEGKKELNVLDLENRSWQTFSNLYYRNSTFSFSNDSKYIAIKQLKGKVLKIYDLHKRKEVKLIKHQDVIRRFSFSNDGKYIYSYSSYPDNDSKGVLKVTNLEVSQSEIVEYYNKLYPPLNKEEKEKYRL